MVRRQAKHGGRPSGRDKRSYRRSCGKQNYRIKGKAGASQFRPRLAVWIIESYHRVRTARRPGNADLTHTQMHTHTRVHGSTRRPPHARLQRGLLPWRRYHSGGHGNHMGLPRKGEPVRCVHAHVCEHVDVNVCECECAHARVCVACVCTPPHATCILTECTRPSGQLGRGSNARLEPATVDAVKIKSPVECFAGGSKDSGHTVWHGSSPANPEPAPPWPGGVPSRARARTRARARAKAMNRARARPGGGCKIY